MSVPKPTTPSSAPPTQYQGRTLTDDEMRVLDLMRCLARQGKPWTAVLHHNGRTLHVMEGVVRYTHGGGS